jgi:hypothetical protein
MKWNPHPLTENGSVALLMVFRSSHGQTGNNRIQKMSLTVGKTAALAHWTWTNTADPSSNASDENSVFETISRGREDLKL